MRQGNRGRRTTTTFAASITVIVAVAAGVIAERSPVLAAPPVSASAVVAVGGNNLGQLGTGSATDSHSAVQVSGLSGGSNGATLVATGELDSLALRADGTVVAWGSNYSGQLGDGTQIDRYTPVSVLGVGGTGVLSGIGCPSSAPPSCVPLAAGDSHALALRPDGSVLAWGNNEFGQLGDGTTLARSAPEQIFAPGSGIVAIAAGSIDSLALKSDGTVLSWGGDGSGQLGNGATNSAANAYTTPAQVTGLGPGSGVTAISAGAVSSLALKGGTVLAWGANTLGQLGDGTACTFSPPAGCVSSSVPVTVAGLSGVTAISAGGLFNAALSGGSVYTWGSNFFGELGRGSGFSGFRSPTATAVVGVGGSGTLTGVTQIAAAQLGQGAVALRSDGSVVGWGLNDHGQLGDGTTNNAKAPVVMTGVTGVRAVSANYSASFALQSAAGTTQVAPPAPLPFPAPAPISKPAPLAASTTAPPANVAATGGTAVSYSTPVVASDPAHPGHLAISYTDGSLSACYISLSNDGGATWSPRTLLGTGGQYPFPPSVSDPTQKMNGCWQPSVAYGPNGNLYYEYNGIDPVQQAYSNLFLMVSTDGGATFRGPDQVNPSEPPASDPTFNGGDSDAFSAPDLAIDTTDGATRGQIYIAYTRSGPNFSGQIRLTRCTPSELQAFAGGATLACDKSTLVDQNDRTFAFLIALPAVGADGSVSVAWQGQTQALFSDVDNPQLVQVATSTDQGQTFGAASTVDSSYNMCPSGGCMGGQFGPQNLHLSITGGQKAGDLAVAVGARRGEGFTRIAVSISHDDGRTWSSRVETGRIAGSLDHSEHAPQLAVSPGGQIGIAYYDTGPDASENLYVITSSDGGATYSAPQRISTQSSNNNIFTAGFPVADETAGLVPTGTGFDVAWADSRRGNIDNDKTDIEFAAVTTVQSSALGLGVSVSVPATGAGESGGQGELVIGLGTAALIGLRRRIGWRRSR